MTWKSANLMTCRRDIPNCDASQVFLRRNGHVKWIEMADALHLEIDLERSKYPSFSIILSWIFSKWSLTKKVQLDLFQSLFSHNFLWLAAFFCCACVFPTKSWTKTTTKVLKVYPTWNYNSKSTWQWMVGRRSFPFGMASWQVVSGSVTKSTCDFFFGSYPVPDCDVGEWRISQRLSECHDLADSTGIEALRNWKPEKFQTMAGCG